MGLPGRKAEITAANVRNTKISSEVAVPDDMKPPALNKEPCLKVIKITSIRSSSGSRSGAYSEDKSMSELVASVASVGIIEPIVVRQTDCDAFVVVAGERRFAAAKLLNFREVPCVVTHCSAGDALVISLIENIERCDLDPIQTACALRRLLDDAGLTQQEIGRRVGMSQSAICHHLRLLSLPRDVQRLISEGALSMGHGKVLAGVSDANDAIEAALECISENKSVREFEAWLSGTRGEVDRRASRRSSKKRREERELKNGLFLIIKERHNEAGSGMIEIPYYCEDDKKWVLDALSGHGTSKLAKNLKQTSVAMSVHGGSRGQPSSLAQDAIA